jgi:heptosyltransferase-2
VWFTKQFPKEKWVELINLLPESKMVFLLGSAADRVLCDAIKTELRNTKPECIFNLAGQLSFLESAALMKDAQMNYVNDSAPMHMASAMNAPVTAVFCSTIPSFGFTPLSDVAKIVETAKKLDCRPCGLHGYQACPQGHFHCAWSIDVKEMVYV